jgi:hypothetical protein
MGPERWTATPPSTCSTAWPSGAGASSMPPQASARPVRSRAVGPRRPGRDSLHRGGPRPDGAAQGLRPTASWRGPHRRACNRRRRCGPGRCPRWAPGAGRTLPGRVRTSGSGAPGRSPTPAIKLAPRVQILSSRGKLPTPGWGGVPTARAGRFTAGGRHRPPFRLPGVIQPGVRTAPPGVWPAVAGALDAENEPGGAGSDPRLDYHY